MPVKVTSVSPIGKLVLPEVWLEVMVTGPRLLSVATALSKMAVPVALPRLALTWMSLGHVSRGASLSMMLTVKMHSALFPYWSRTVCVMTVVPSGKSSPLLCDEVTMSAFCELSSTRAAGNRATPTLAPGRVGMVRDGGHVILGGVTSAQQGRKSGEMGGECM